MYVHIYELETWVTNYMCTCIHSWCVPRRHIRVRMRVRTHIRTWDMSHELYVYQHSDMSHELETWVTYYKCTYIHSWCVPTPTSIYMSQVRDMIAGVTPYLEFVMEPLITNLDHRFGCHLHDKKRVCNFRNKIPSSWLDISSSWQQNRWWVQTTSIYMSPVRDSMSQVRELLRSSIELLITYLDHAFGCQVTWPKKIRVRDACLKFVTAESLMRTDTPRYTRLNRVIQCLNLVIRSVKFVVELPITNLDYELGRNFHNKKKIQDRDPYLKFVTVEPLMRTDKPLYVHS